MLVYCKYHSSYCLRKQDIYSFYIPSFCVAERKERAPSLASIKRIKSQEQIPTEWSHSPTSPRYNFSSFCEDSNAPARASARDAQRFRSSCSLSISFSASSDLIFQRSRSALFFSANTTDLPNSALSASRSLIILSTAYALAVIAASHVV